MKIIRFARGMIALSRSLHRKGRTIGFVPTMGALHRGHLSLIQRSRRENDRTVVSIFVNPIQFGPSEDFQRYPRPVAKDNKLCREAGVDILYRPSVHEMYPEGFCTRVEVQGLADGLCGRSRPGHFEGVTTVVFKLLNAVQADRAYFGEKDYQQLIVLQQMARDLNLPVQVIGCPIIREPDGLALSSRNAYLKLAERRHAPLLHKALALGAAMGRNHRGSIANIRRATMNSLKTIPKVRIEYVEIVDAATLRPARKLGGRLRIAAAIRIGRTRLIDNIALICKD